jgi:hypothetical protein
VKEIKVCLSSLIKQLINSIEMSKNLDVNECEIGGGKTKM